MPSADVFNDFFKTLEVTQHEIHVLISEDVEDVEDIEGEQEKSLVTGAVYWISRPKTRLRTERGCG